MGTFSGRHTLKVELGSREDVSAVMDQKVCLGTSLLKDLRSVYIRRSKTQHQRTQEHNHRMMMKAMRMQGKFFTDKFGRLQEVKDTSASGADNSSLTGAQSGSSGDGEFEAGLGERDGERGGGRRSGRGRGRVHGRARGNPNRRGRGGVFFGPQRPPLQVNQKVMDAFTRPSNDNSPSQDVDDGGGSVTNSN